MGYRIEMCISNHWGDAAFTDASVCCAGCLALRCRHSACSCTVFLLTNILMFRELEGASAWFLHIMWVQRKQLLALLVFFVQLD